MTREQAKDKLIDLLLDQVTQLTLMSKIELGDDVIAEIKLLKAIITQPPMPHNLQIGIDTAFEYSDDVSDLDDTLMDGLEEK